jgi:short-subunit dehydrogenase
VAKVVFITGASSGIGRAAALAFARQGDHVAGMARRVDRLQELADEINRLPAPHGDFLPVTGDVTDAAAVQEAVQQTVVRFGRIDVAVANAGLGQRGAVADAEWADLETVLRTNIDGVMHVIRAVVPPMRTQGGGQIITISSVVATLVSPYAAIYAASKAFVSSLAASLRIELEADKISITDIFVGRTNTEFDEKRRGAGKRSAGGLPTMTPEKVAEALVKAADKRPKTVVLRAFDRLILFGNWLLPGLMGELARRQYK